MPSDQSGPQAEIHSVTDILRESGRIAHDREKVSVEDIVDGLGRDALNPLLLVPALAVTTPLSGIPGLSALSGIVIALVSFQLLIGRESIWLPDWVMRRKLPGDRMEKASEWLARAAKFLDGISRDRLQAIVTPPGARVAQGVCFLSGLIMPALEFVPFSSSILGAGVSLIAIGLVTRDGVFVLVALAAYAALGALLVSVLGGAF
ncbi:exopolysaccharide biosynthesis protein [Poseidonocella sedimentorum]|uniref:Uncharacterized conserved protein n=1 Tax=Poseidonocella sedimentorum TaxID=871652 RepID=A0A1I6DTF3_9RHOB|nr:exopolysaccharide biosynthesis protein [Poseidonocella sedimentorum]SFR08632.1 Uncharacterized conserved protein [Poseidonocella sedimentorum]